MNHDEQRFGEHSDQIEAIAEEIRNKIATVQACDGEVEVRAMATGHVVDLTISPLAIRRYDAAALSGQLLAAIQSATAEAANMQLEALRPAIGEARSFRQLFELAGTAPQERESAKLPSNRESATHSEDFDDDYAQTTYLR
ncbi:YbaB/EbfC family nucleoid-associated protein [Saccharopolyspora sp. NPDC050642]|uniref:YbaB/EbfC family nucleoid-associated protein n=1 Tax=Saccharopolyspora sp. NPDC050642 TaxID=3157099 RepID=UPI0033D5E785